MEFAPHSPLPADSDRLPWPEYLDRIGYAGPVEPTADCLRALLTAHLGAVPYEMLESLEGIRPSLEYADIFEKLVRRRRGGTCLEATPLFGAFLRSAGFDVRLVAAQMWRVSGEWWPHWDHLVLLVTVEGTTYLVDVGFLMLSPPQPLDIAGTPAEQGGWTFRVVAEDDGPTLLRADAHGVWTPVYRFASQPLDIPDYAWIVDFHLTAEDSPLTGSLLCSRTLPDGKVAVLGDNVVRARGGTQTIDYLADAADAAQALGEVLAGHPELVTEAVEAWRKARANRREKARRII
ncbi:arylamine N-acetyltransferase [Streptomyces sp. SAI-208]|nr:arylamine N-acetyltransferase [Streptomyces sp. SAI-041]MDH6605990.1 arylamine N-acetyltransferase [Streptomyces sp. SAI-208]